MVKIKKLGVLSFALFLTYMGALVGLLAGILYSVGGFFVDLLVTLGWVVTNETPGLSYGTVLAFGALIGMPLIFAIFGFVIGIVGAIMFNIFSKWVSGIDVEIEGK